MCPNVYCRFDRRLWTTWNTVRSLKRSFNCPRSDKGQRDLPSQANRNRFNIASKVRLSWLIKHNCNAMIIIFSVVTSALLAAIAFLVITLIGKYHALADLRKLPGPWPNVFFGNAWQLPSNPEGIHTVSISFQVIFTCCKAFKCSETSTKRTPNKLYLAHFYC